MEIQEKVARYVHDNGIMQKHIAEKTGISKVKISQMFNGNRKMMADEFVLICAAINKEPNDFINTNEE